MTERPLVTMTICTRRPEDYLLVDEGNGSQWRIVNGEWQRQGWQPPTDPGSDPVKRRRT